jgi:hypothetical protein
MRKLYVLATVLLATLAASAATIVSAAVNCPPCPICH